jgi:hypothetical protein
MNIYIFIPNPFKKNLFTHLWSFSKLLTEFKCLELEFYRDDESLFMIDFLIRIKQDHEGFDFSLNLLTLVFHFTIYDTRHLDAFSDMIED